MSQGLCRPVESGAEKTPIPATKGSSRRRATCHTLQQKGVPKKITRQGHRHALTEISSQQITMTFAHIGSGSYGCCYLGMYRSIDIIINELGVQQLQCESRGDAETRVVQELI